MLVHFEKTEKGIVIQVPDEMADISVFASGDTVEVLHENGRLIVSRPDEPRFDIEAMIATITPENRHAEIKTGPPRGNEVW